MSNLELLAQNGARLVTERHVTQFSAELQRSFQMAQDRVQTVSNEFDLLVVFGIVREIGKGHIIERVELRLQVGVGLEEPVTQYQGKQNKNLFFKMSILLDEDGGNNALAILANVFPCALHVTNLVGGQTG